MNRSEIKNLAKEKIKGKKWDILWPLLVISFISSALSTLFGPKIDLTTIESLEELQNIHFSFGQYGISSLITIITSIITAGYTKYLLNYVRTGKFNTDEIINTIKAKWLDLLIADVLVTIIVAVLSMLFVIPGIIAGLALAMTTFLIIDKDVKGHESIKESAELMKGHKWDYFVFHLSFIGWYLLVPFTLGILLIWLVPYVNVATAIYYDKLISKKN